MRSSKWRSKVWLFLLIVPLVSKCEEVNIIFTPSPNIGVYQLAHYYCSVDHTGVSITWNVNNTLSTNTAIVQLGIVTVGAATGSSNLTIPGYPQYNNTVVKCITAGFLNNADYINISESKLIIQGKLAKLGNLTCTRQGHCCIMCSWSPPFSLDGVPIYGYIINVTNEGDNTQYTTTSNTTSWIYCPSQFGNYTISIAGNNSAGEGEIKNQIVILPKVCVTNWEITAINRSKSSWTINVQTMTSQKCLDHIESINIQLLGSNKTSFFIATDLEITVLTTFYVVATIQLINISENRIWETRLSVVYKSGLNITSTNTLKLSTYDITEATLYNDLSNIGRSCYSCHFIRGAIVKGCLISLTSSTYSTNISLMCSPVCSSTVIGCTYDLPTGIYNMYVYDIEEEGRLSEHWAISSTNITITGMESTYTSLDVTRSVSTCPVSMVTVTSKTCDCLTNDTQVKKEIVTVAGSLLGVSILILVCTVLVHIVICWIRRTKSLRQGTVPSPANPLTDNVPHQVIPQYDNVDMVTPTTELEMDTCPAYGVIK